MNNKLQIFLFLTVVLVLSFATSTVSLALELESAKINGLSDTYFFGGGKAEATVKILLNSNDAWKSTAYKVGDGNWTCVDTPDHWGKSGNWAFAEETFPILIQGEEGINKVFFQAYGNEGCSTENLSGTASLMNSVTGLFSFGVNGLFWAVLIILFVFILALVMLAVYYKMLLLKKRKDTATGETV